MKVAALLLLCCIPAFAQTPHIKSGSTVYIEPMDGYETYLAAAFAKKHVPLVVVMDKSKAEYVITSTVEHTVPNQPAVVVNNTNIDGANADKSDNGVSARIAERAAERAARGSTSASISVIDVQSSQISFAYSVGKSRDTNQVQSAAEACAKHLKEFIEKQK